MFKVSVHVDLHEPDSEVVKVGQKERVPVMSGVECCSRWKQFPGWDPEKRLEDSMSPERIQNEPCCKVNAKISGESGVKYVIDAPSRRHIALIVLPEAGGYILRYLCTIRGCR